MITISGLITPEQKREILNYAKFCAKELGVRGNILITVSLYGNDNGMVSQLAANKFEIWLNKALIGGREQRLLRETLGHEFQHIKQFQQKRLEIKGSLLYFEGVSMAAVPYIQRPFEVEARRAGRELLEKWQKLS
jgi:hypothetical protein